jgi:hypothetical protein
VQKVLPKAAGGVGFQFRKQSLDVAQCHAALIAIFHVIHKGDVNNPLGRVRFLPKLFTFFALEEMCYRV